LKRNKGFMVGSSGTMVRAGLIVRQVGHVVVNLPRLVVLIPLADQPKLNVQAKAYPLKNPQNLYLGNPRRKEKRNEKEKVF
jgi:hypothetical protein